MRQYLPLIVAAKFQVVGQDITASARATSTSTLTLTLTGHTLAVGDKAYLEIAGGGAAPSGIYAVSAVAGNNVNFAMGATYTNPSAAGAKWKKTGGNLSAGLITITGGSASTVAFTVTGAAGSLGSLGGALTVGSDTAGSVAVCATLGVTNSILLVKHVG